jgi:hypothetical protein
VRKPISSRICHSVRLVAVGVPLDSHAVISPAQNVASDKLLLMAMRFSVGLMGHNSTLGRLSWANVRVTDDLNRCVTDTYWALADLHAGLPAFSVINEIGQMLSKHLRIINEWLMPAFLRPSPLEILKFLGFEPAMRLSDPIITVWILLHSLIDIPVFFSLIFHNFPWDNQITFPSNQTEWSPGGNQSVNKWVRGISLIFLHNHNLAFICDITDVFLGTNVVMEMV